MPSTILHGGAGGLGSHLWAPTHGIPRGLALSPRLLNNGLGPFQSHVLHWDFPGGGGEGRGLASNSGPQAQGENLLSQAGRQDGWGMTQGVGSKRCPVGAVVGPSARAPQTRPPPNCPCLLVRDISAAYKAASTGGALL